MTSEWPRTAWCAVCVAAVVTALPLGTAGFSGAFLPHPATVSSRLAAAALPDQPPTLPGAPRCGPSLADPGEPSNGRTQPPPAPTYFPADFPRVADDLWGYSLGGIGGVRRLGRLHHTPVVFVHGNQADAQNWLDVMLQFAASAGYTMQEMYAISYNGLGNYYGGTPLQLVPSSLDRDYLTQNPQTLNNGGHGSANDDEVPDLCRFVEAVQWYTGSPQIDVVAHSLGVTIARRFMELYPSLARDVVAFVGIAGANHGTTVCRGAEHSYYGCNEIAPGSPWLAELNAHGETYPPTHWMTVYDGALGDPFYVGPDAPSPRLEGADNRTFNTAGVHGDYHDDLRVDPPEVQTYLAFLLRYGQAGPGAATGVDAVATRLEQQAQQAEASNQTVPSVYRLTEVPLCIPALTQSSAGCDLAEGPQPATEAPASGPLGGAGASPPLPGTSASPGGPLVWAPGVAGLAGLAALARRRRAPSPRRGRPSRRGGDVAARPRPRWPGRPRQRPP